MAHSTENILSLLPLLGEQIDRLVYELYGLTEDEISLDDGRKEKPEAPCPSA